MRGLQSLKKQEAKLRARHTEQAVAGQWPQAQTTRDKLIQTLNQIRELENQAMPKP